MAILAAGGPAGRGDSFFPLVGPLMAVFGPASPGFSDAGDQSQIDPIIQQLMQRFPGLAGLTGANQPGTTTSSSGYGFPGVNLYSGQAASGGGLYGSTGTGIFEGASQGQPESVTGGLSSGFLGKSPSQAPLSNTGQPGTGGGGGGGAESVQGQSPMSGAGSFSSLSSAGDLSGQSWYDSQNLLGYPPQQYNLMGPVKQVLGGVDSIYRMSQAGQPTASLASSYASGATPTNLMDFNPDFAAPLNPVPGAFDEIPAASGVLPSGSFDVSTGTESGRSGASNGLLGSALDKMGLGQYAGPIGQGLGVLGGLSGLYGLVQGIQGGDAGKIYSGLYGSGSGLLSATGLGAIPFGTSAAGLASAEAGLGLGAGEALGGTLGGAFGMAAAPLAIFYGLQSMNTQMQDANKLNAMAHDTNQIRKAFGTAYPQLESGGQAYQMLQMLPYLPPDAQQQLLGTIRDWADVGRSSIPAVSQFISTQGGRHSSFNGAGEVAPMDVSQYEARTPDLYMQTVLAQMAAEDMLANRGVEMPTSGYHAWDPMQTLGLLSPTSGMPNIYRAPLSARSAYGLPDLGATGINTPIQQDEGATYLPEDVYQSLQKPGGRLSALQQYLTGLSPDFATSKLGMALQQIRPLIDPIVGDFGPGGNVTLPPGLLYPMATG